MKLLITLLIVIMLVMACGQEIPASAGETGHSELPWRAVPNGMAYNLENNEGGDHFCILLGMVYQPQNQHKANVDFIVATVNAMPEIKKFLSELVDQDFDRNTTVKAAAILEKLNNKKEPK